MGNPICKLLHRMQSNVIDTDIMYHILITIMCKYGYYHILTDGKNR
jgi:hypothetical protein